MMDGRYGYYIFRANIWRRAGSIGITASNVTTWTERSSHEA